MTLFIRLGFSSEKKKEGLELVHQIIAIKIIKQKYLSSHVCITGI